MKILLLKDVKHFGKRGEVKDISDGYARNFLIPKGLAAPASEGAMKAHAIEIRAREMKSGKREAERAAYIATLKQTTIQISRKASPAGALYEGVGRDDVLTQLHNIGLKELTVTDIDLTHAMKQIGKHEVPVHVGTEKAYITLEIIAA
ncbi:MAG: 50S ribosomal protein L9 [Patescibacteria group bacterium]